MRDTSLQPRSPPNGASSAGRGPPDPAHGVETLLGQIAGEFTERLNKGERPDIEDYVRRYPQIADLLRQVLPALQVMGPGSRDSLSAWVGAEGHAPSGAEGHAPSGAEGHAPFGGLLGDFRILREVGRGGMGVVYEAEQRIYVQEALNSMDPMDREVLALKHFEQLSTSEIAQVLGLSKAGAGSRYLRAIKRLREILEEIPGFRDL